MHVDTAPHDHSCPLQSAAYAEARPHHVVEQQVKQSLSRLPLTRTRTHTRTHTRTRTRTHTRTHTRTRTPTLTRTSPAPHPHPLPTQVKERLSRLPGVLAVPASPSSLGPAHTHTLIHTHTHTHTLTYTLTHTHTHTHTHTLTLTLTHTLTPPGARRAAASRSSTSKGGLAVEAHARMLDELTVAQLRGVAARGRALLLGTSSDLVSELSSLTLLLETSSDLVDAAVSLDLSSHPHPHPHPDPHPHPGGRRRLGRPHRAVGTPPSPKPPLPAPRLPRAEQPSRPGRNPQPHLDADLHTTRTRAGIDAGSARAEPRCAVMNACACAVGCGRGRPASACCVGVVLGVACVATRGVGRCMRGRIPGVVLGVACGPRTRCSMHDAGIAAMAAERSPAGRRSRS